MLSHKLTSLVCLVLCTVYAADAAAHPDLSLHATVNGGQISVIEGLLSGRKVIPRQQRQCPIAGGTFCNSLYCCYPGTICQVQNTSIPRACCPVQALSCNGGTACCRAGIAKCCAAGCCPIDSGNGGSATPTKQTDTSPTPTETRIPKGTVALDYNDMIIPRKNSKVQDPAVRKKAVDSLFKNMCQGMQERGKLTEKQSEIFTYSRKSQSSNRKTACGKVTCASGFSCDEFPFASTEDGGDGAIANCIEELGNSVQGGFLSTLLKSENIGEGDHYELQLSNVKCEDLLPRLGNGRRELFSRQQPPTSGLTSQLQPISVWTFGAFLPFDLYDHGIYPLGDLSSGTYTVDVLVTDGIIDAARIIDYQGFSYAGTDRTLGILDDPTSFIFTLTEDAVGVTLMVDNLIDYNISASMSSGGSSRGSGSSTAIGGSSTSRPLLPSSAIRSALWTTGFYGLVATCGLLVISISI